MSAFFLSHKSPIKKGRKAPFQYFESGLLPDDPLHEEYHTNQHRNSANDPENIASNDQANNTDGSENDSELEVMIHAAGFRSLNRIRFLHFLRLGDIAFNLFAELLAECFFLKIGRAHV